MKKAQFGKDFSHIRHIEVTSRQSSRAKCIPSMLQNAVSKNRNHTREKPYQPCCTSFINRIP
jgi:hypothetical protein